MRNTIQKQQLSSSTALLMLFLLWAFNGNAQVANQSNSEFPESETVNQTETLWEIKAYKIFEKLLDVKAIAKDGKQHDVIAIQYGDDRSLLDVKVFIEGQRLPVKMIIKNGERYYPVKAIDNNGTLIDIKAITPEGDILPIKGVSKSGNIVHIRAIKDDHIFYNIIAISPDGEFNHVKGVKMIDNPVETIINGVSIFAHVKSIK